MIDPTTLCSKQSSGQDIFIHRHIWTQHNDSVPTFVRRCIDFHQRFSEWIPCEGSDSSSILCFRWCDRSILMQQSVFRQGRYTVAVSWGKWFQRMYLYHWRQKLWRWWVGILRVLISLSTLYSLRRFNSNHFASNSIATDPSCADLVIIPGSAEQNCRSYCPSDTTPQVEDFVQYASATSNNPDQSSFVISCRCSGVVACSDSILFSDRIDLPECSDVSITSMGTCKAKCESYGSLFLGFDYQSKNDGEVSICSCSRGENVAPFCEDLDRGAAVNVSGAASSLAVVATSWLAVMSMMVI